MFVEAPGTYNGFKVVENQSFTEAGEPYKVIRTFKERWFTMPWHPFKKTRMVTPQVPSKQIIKHGNTLFMHPAVFLELKRFT